MRVTIALAALLLASCGSDAGADRSEALDAAIASLAPDADPDEVRALVEDGCATESDNQFSIFMHILETDGKTDTIDLFRSYCPDRVNAVLD